MAAVTYHGKANLENSNSDCEEVTPTNYNDVLIHSEQSELDITWDDEKSQSGCEIREAQLPLSSSSSLSSVSFDNERKDIELVNSSKKWPLKHNATQQCTNDILEIFIELGYSVL